VSIKYLIILFCFLLLVPLTYADATASFLGDKELIYDFDKPKGETFSLTRVIRVTLGNESGRNIQDLSVSFYGIDGITASIDDASKSFYLNPNTHKDITVTFYASSSMEEKTYTGGVLSITGTNLASQNITGFTVKINYPNPTIRAIWDKVDWGNVKAGTSFKRILTVEEYYGYKNASNVTVLIAEIGPAELLYSGEIGDLDPLESKNIQVNVTIPQKGLKPGTYNIKPIITSTSVITSEPQEAKYTIPQPKMEISKKTIDMGKITFEPGKDTTTRIITISEVGGFTPIEGLSFSLTNGPKGWVSIKGDDYIAPGESENYSFSITLPPDASLGDKDWAYDLKTHYAGKQTIYLYVTVYFPGIEEATGYLKNLSASTDSQEEKSLIQDTLLLLENAKGKTEIRKIAMVMSVYSGVRSLLSYLEDSEKDLIDGKLISSADAIIKANSALNKIRIGDENLEDAELKLQSSKSVTAAQNLWQRFAKNVLKDLENKAAETKENDYKVASLLYKRMSEISKYSGDEKKAREYQQTQQLLQDRYEKSLLSASEDVKKAEIMLRNARSKMFQLGEGEGTFYFVYNPLDYDEVSTNYESAIKNYETAESLYRKAGEIKDAERIAEELQILYKQKNQIFIAFVAYGSILVLTFIWFMGRVTIGMQRFKQDDRESSVGDVVIGED